jgi:L-rhamnose-H+ transport protein
MDTLIGLVLAFAGGAIQGAFVFPMKFMKNCRWENGWFLFSLVCCLIFPTALAFGTTPRLLEIYSAAGWNTVGLVFLFGLGWGVGVVLFGLGAEFLGMALGIALITAINVCLGALFPILFLSASQFTTTAGVVLGAGLLVMVAGVAVISQAGRLRQQQRGGTAAGASKVPFKVGLLVCIVAGFFCPSTNFAVFFGQPITEAVKQLGTVAPYNVGHAQMLPFFLGGWLVNTAYCLYLLRKHESFANFSASGSFSNVAKAVVMAVLFVGGMVLYVVATSLYLSGGSGAVVGWPVFMGATILISNLLGVFSGEWKGVGRRVYGWLYGGVALLILAVVLASLSNLFVVKTAITLGS